MALESDAVGHLIKQIASIAAGEVQLWDAQTGKRCAYHSGLAPGWSSIVAWSPDGTRLASFSTSGGQATAPVEVWEAPTGQDRLTYQPGETFGNWFTCLAWSPNGRYLAAGTWEKHTVQVRDAATGRLIYTYGGHSDVVRSVAWSPDSTRIASASSDGTVQVWDTTTGRHVYVYTGHTVGKQYGFITVGAVSWSPDGRFIASGDWGNNGLASPGQSTVQVWRPG